MRQSRSGTMSLRRSQDARPPGECTRQAPGPPAARSTHASLHSTYKLIDAGLISSVVVTWPGSRRGRRLIDGDSLDSYLETLAPIFHNAALIVGSIFAKRRIGSYLRWLWGAVCF